MKKQTESTDTAKEAAKGKKPPPRVRLPLSTVRACTRELARLYKSAKANQIGVADASKLANILSILTRCLADDLMEERINNLERIYKLQRKEHEPTE